MNDDDDNNRASSNTSLYNGGFVGILNLPVGSTITYDNNQPLKLQRDDFVGFTTPFADGNDNDNNDNNDFHLVTVRAAVGKKGAGGSEQLGVAAGFILPRCGGDQQQQQQDNNCLLLLRQYDPTTEEVSSVPVDQTTTHNLMRDLRNRQIQPHRIIDYNQLLPGAQQQMDNKWKNLTNYISSNLLQKRGGVNAGDKIVAGSYDDDIDDIDIDNTKDINTNKKMVEDGKSISYPCIPVMNNKTNANSHLQHCQHEGTKRWLATTKTPSQRTQLFMAPNPASLVLEQILNEYYDNNHRELLGDVQLSYVVFLQLHCYASLVHWRDMVAMMCCVERDGITRHANLFCDFLEVLCCQLTTMEGEDFFVDDADMSEGNFLIPSLQQLTTTLSQIVVNTTTTASDGGDGGDGGNNNSRIINRLDDALFKLNRILSQKFPSHFGGPEIISEYATTPGANINGHVVASDNIQQQPENDRLMMMMVQDDESDMDEDDEDGPVVVPMEEFESSLARSEAAVAADLERRSRIPASVSYPAALRKQYPVLFAAIMPNEDVLMTCARALDDKSDVSLVREAADYLEHVEAKK